MTAMLEIRLQIDRTASGGATLLRAIDIVDRRPNVGAALAGLAAPAALDLIGRLYGICGSAQRLAARLALCAAGREDRPPEPAMHDAVRRERVQEHAWRLLVDWPRAVGMPADTARLRAVLAELASADSLERSGRRLQSLLADLSTVPHAGIDTLLAAIAAREARVRTDDATRPVSTRVASRAEALRRELASWTGEAAPPPAAGTAQAMAPGMGRSEVATARGPLSHEVRLQADRVAQWDIVVPTDRHFASDGPLPQLIAGIHADDDAGYREAASDCVRALDPCVEWNVEVRHA